MRENIGIFRGKRVDTGLWKEGYLLGLQDKISGKDLFFIVDKMGEYHRVDPETVGEFTGMTDVDGDGIYENDILTSLETHIKAIVSYSVADRAFTAWSPQLKETGYLGEVESSIVAIIGNIHDNPEMLEKGSDENEHRKET